MCSESIKAHAVVLEMCAVPLVCQTLTIIVTPAASLQSNPGCFFLLAQLISSCLSPGRCPPALQLSSLEQLLEQGGQQAGAGIVSCFPGVFPDPG